MHSFFLKKIIIVGIRSIWLTVTRTFVLHSLLKWTISDVTCRYTKEEKITQSEFSTRYNEKPYLSSDPTLNSKLLVPKYHMHSNRPISITSNKILSDLNKRNEYEKSQKIKLLAQVAM